MEASPAFQKLKNPLLRKTLPSLVTVAQAARMGGLNPEELVARLNRALGVEARPGVLGAGEAESLLGTPPPSWVSAPLGFHLDVRPILEEGGEPFQAIMPAAKEVKPGERLVLKVLFEPIPLYKVLGKQGFVAWCERLGERHYRVHFYRVAAGLDQGMPKGPIALRAGSVGEALAKVFTATPALRDLALEALFAEEEVGLWLDPKTLWRLRPRFAVLLSGRDVRYLEALATPLRKVEAAQVL